MRTRTTVGTRLAAVVLVPLVALGWLAADTVRRARRDHDAAVVIAVEAADVGRFAHLVLDLRVEHEMSIVVVGTAEYGVSPLLIRRFVGVDPADALAAARADVDAAWAGTAGLDDARARLAALRAQVDGGDLRIGGQGLHDLRVVADDVRVALDQQVAELRRSAATAGASGRAANDSTTVVQAVDALLGTLDGAGNAVAIALGVSPDPAGDAIGALEGAAVALQALTELATSGTAAGDAARQLLADPALADTGARIDRIATAAAGGGGAAVPIAEVPALVQGVLARIAGAGRLVDLAAADARAHADADAAHAAATAWRLTAAAVGTLLAAVAFAVVVARATARPLRAIEHRAQQLADGVVPTDPLPRRGPREAVAASVAIDGLVRALTEVERSARALADGDLEAAGRTAAGEGRFAAPVHDAVERLRRAMAEANELRDELAHAASHDALTGLPNRAALLASLDADLAGVGQPAVAFVDLDGFKAANDEHGHATGDAALMVVADRLRTLVGDGAAARFGGDEFVCVLRGPDPARTCERIVEAISMPIQVGSATVLIGASVGLAVAGPGESATRLVGRADEALYAAKTAGRGRVVVDAAGAAR